MRLKPEYCGAGAFHGQANARSIKGRPSPTARPKDSLAQTFHLNISATRVIVQTSPYPDHVQHMKRDVLPACGLSTRHLVSLNADSFFAGSLPGIANELFSVRLSP